MDDGVVMQVVAGGMILWVGLYAVELVLILVRKLKKRKID